MTERKQLIHRLLGTTVRVQVDRPAGFDHNGLIYPINYGYLPGITAGDGEEQDAYILGVREPVTSFEGQVVGAVIRKNDLEDKLIVAPEGMVFHQGQIAEATHFQERFFDTYIISLFRKSCGVLPYRIVNGIPEFLLVFESFSQCWSLPKGHMEAGETEADTALRELYEETGLTARLDTVHRAVIEYPISPRGTKQVVFFAGAVQGEPRIPSGEIERFRWIRQEELTKYLFPDTVAACVELIQKAQIAP